MARIGQASIDDPAGTSGVIAMHDGADPVHRVADEAGHLRHVVARGNQSEHVPVAAFDGILALAVAAFQFVDGEMRGDGQAAGHANPPCRYLLQYPTMVYPKFV